MADSGLGVYKAIIRVKAARIFDVGGFLMRFFVYMQNIGVVTMLTLSGYSFLLAGLISSLIALTSFLVTPRISKLIDERGQSRIVPIASLVTLAGLTGMLACVAAHAPEPLLFVCAFLMGCVPNPQALVRSRWTYLIRTGRLPEDKAPTLRAVFSYEGVIDDIGFMVAPALSISLAAAIAPVAGMLFGGVAFAIGAVVLCLSRSTEPEPGWTAPGEAGAEAGEAQAAEAAEAGEGGKRADVPTGPECAGHADAAAPGRHDAYDPSLYDTAKTIFRSSPVVRILFVMMLCVGGFYGIFDTATVSLAEDLGNPNIASLVLALSCAVSVGMGIVFGMIRLRMPQYAQLVLTGALLGTGYMFMFVIDSAPTLLAVGILAAIFYAPFFITANATCERAVPGQRYTEAVTWVNAGVTCGMALGPTLAGVVIDALGTTRAFDVGALFAAALLVTALVSARMLKRRVPDDVTSYFSRRESKHIKKRVGK